MNFRCPPKTDNPNLDTWLGEFGKQFADSATTLAGLSKSAKANFDWNGKQLVNVGGIHIGGTSLPGKGNLIVDGDFNLEAGAKLNVKSGGDINIDSGGDINIEGGGDIILTPSDANPALVKWSTVYNLGSAATALRGICLWPTVANTGSFRVGYDPINAQNHRFDLVVINAESTVGIHAYTDDNYNAGIDVVSGSTSGFVRIYAKEAGSIFDLYLNPSAGAFYADSGTVNIGSSAKKFNQGWFADYVIAEGGIHVGDTSDPGTDNLVVDNQAGFGAGIQAAYQLYSQAPDAQSTIQTAIHGYTLSDAVDNYGMVGIAAGGGGTNNYGVYGNAINAPGNNYPFYDVHGNYTSAARWEDVSDPERKALIRDLRSGEDEEFYSMLDGFHVKGYRMKAEIPILGYSETEVDIDELGEERSKPILDEPEKARELFGLLANDPDLPEFIPGLDKKGIGAGGIASYLIVICQYQKELINDHEQRIEQLEAA